MQNDAGEFVDLYLPRKCSASNRIIAAKDHTSIQMNVVEVHKVTGRFNGQFKTYALCGAIRRMGESDDSILRLSKADGIVSKNFLTGENHEYGIFVLNNVIPVLNSSPTRKTAVSVDSGSLVHLHVVVFSRRDPTQ
ncbi:small ribosomal subunit protein eS21-like [Aotus nancymaae]|uniref:small ribosomal subunit protein eS21-like n=1 Tax=Aotus nancymaae TaxID=37293 RepID=UPI0030FEC5F2